MKCPHCGVACHEQWRRARVGSASEEPHDTDETAWELLFQACPECRKPIVRIREGVPSGYLWSGTRKEYRVFPLGDRRPLPLLVSGPYRDQFREASELLAVSPRASAAVSRRCLYSLLRDKAKVRAHDLNAQLEELLNAGHLPDYLIQSIETLLQFGNMRTYAVASTEPWAIPEAVPGEAEWLLDTLEAFVDFYIVHPMNVERRRNELSRGLKSLAKAQPA